MEDLVCNLDISLHSPYSMGHITRGIVKGIQTSATKFLQCKLLAVSKKMKFLT